MVEQRPAGSTIVMRSTAGMPVKEGEDPMPWLRAQAPDLELKGIPALEALCRITEGARPDSVWNWPATKTAAVLASCVVRMARRQRPPSRPPRNRKVNFPGAR